MKSTLIVLLAIVGLTVAISDKETIQQILNGLFEQNKLKDPTTIVPCIDDASAHKIVVFIGQILDKAAKGSLSDLLSLPQLIKDFGNSLDPAVSKCLDGNAEFASLGDAFNVTGVDSSVIEKKVITYVTLHYLSVHKWLGDVNSDFHNGQFYQVGWKTAEEGHLALKLNSIPAISDKETIQQALNGIFEQNKLKNSTTIVPCIDDASARKIVVFAGQLLDKAARGSLSDLLAIPQLVKDFGNSLDPAVSQCLDGNSELNTLGDIYNITSQPSDYFEKKIITYVTLHYLSVHKWLVDVDNDWNAGKFYSVGWKAGEEGHLILGIGRERFQRIYALVNSLRSTVEHEFMQAMTQLTQA